jgi:hypothetical protein
MFERTQYQHHRLQISRRMTCQIKTHIEKLGVTSTLTSGPISQPELTGSTAARDRMQINVSVGHALSREMSLRRIFHQPAGASL